LAAAGGHTLEIEEKRIGGVAIVNDGTPLPAVTLAARSTPTPFCSAR